MILIKFYIVAAYVATAAFILVMAWLVYETFKQEAHPLALVGDYRVSNYTSNDGKFMVFLVSKEKLNQSVILINDNDITEKILVTRIPY